MRSHIVYEGTIAICACIVIFASSIASAQKKPTSSLPPNPKSAPSRLVEPAVASLDIQPKDAKLIGPRAIQRMIVIARYADGSEADVTSQTRFISLAPKNVVIQEGSVLVPRADGTAQVKVLFGGRSSIVPVFIQDSQKHVPVNFVKEVVSIVSKAGCNQGGCHGAQYGKGGFKVSLFGYEPDLDYKSMVKSSEGRRVIVSEPERSLVLLKPTMQVPHGGGLRFEKDSWQYRIIMQWLEDGAPGPATVKPAVERLEVSPAVRLMKEGEKQRLVVRAFWSDGTVEDVSRKALYTSNGEGTATVSPDGLVGAAGQGSTSIMVRYMGAASVSRVDVPFEHDGAGRSAGFAEYNFIDRLVAQKWERLGIIPSKDCSDSTFIRRVYFDATGTLPSIEEARRFITDPDKDKRKKLIDQILERPEYADFWTLKWADLLRNNSDRLQPKGMWSFHLWIHAAMRDNKPLDQFVRELLTSQGSTYSNGPSNFFRVAGNPPDRAEAVAQTFLGIRLQCARCHHHPFEKWSQNDYYGFAAFFARVGTKGSQDFGLFGGEQVVVVTKGGDVRHPKTGSVMKPTPLDEKPIDSLQSSPDPRRLLADWLTRPDNMLFARNIANRFWGYTMGRGLVEPIDDMRATNPPSNPELLDALAKDLIAHKFDQKHLLRTIFNSHVYQLSADATPTNKRDEMFYSHYIVRRLSAEELFDAINFATQTDEKFNGLPMGTRAIQLPDPNVASYFLDTFGRAPRVITCECERSGEPNMSQALHLMNSDFIQNKITNGNGRVQRLLKEIRTDKEMIEELYLTTFSRLPVESEYAVALEIISRAASRREGLEDLMWSLLNSREFLFQH